MARGSFALRAKGVSVCVHADVRQVHQLWTLGDNAYNRGLKGFLVLLMILLLACSFMLCDLYFWPSSLSLSSMPSCDLVSLTNMLILFIILKALFQSLRKSLSLNLELSRYVNSIFVGIIPNIHFISNIPKDAISNFGLSLVDPLVLLDLGLIPNLTTLLLQEFVVKLRCCGVLLLSNNGHTPAVQQTESSPEIPAKTSVETVLNMTPENKAHYESEKEAIHLILTGIGDEIYSTVDACQTATRNVGSHEGYIKVNHSIFKSHAATGYKGKREPKQYTTPSETALEEDSDPEQSSEGQRVVPKNLALIAKYFKKLYKPTNNNLRTSSNTRNKNVDTTPRLFTARNFGHYAKECRKPKRVKDPVSTRKKMLLCKQAEKGVQLQAEQSDGLAVTMR
ncbi:hypothetical protein Tco_0863695 [Tanacetum coccineum]